MKIISPRRTVTEVTHSLHFQQVGHAPGTGYGFPCDQRGRVQVDVMGAAAHESYERLCRDPAGYRPPVVERRERVERRPAVGRCACGRHVELEGFTNTCDCGRDYNSAGQELAPRACWGEETGEDLVDILRIR